jgi:Domain of unknown function (DUF5671)
MAISDELFAFVRDALTRGLSRRDVEVALRQAGWSPERVDAALAAFAQVDFPIPVPRPQPSLSAREAFTYLLVFTTLYTVAFNLGRLSFEFINLAFPDPASSPPQRFVADSIRWSVSSLIVALPVFLYMSRTASRAVAIDPNMRLSPVRRWLTYLTLFIAACVLIGDFVSLVYSVLGGELTVRFVMKVMTVGAIAGTVFWYYLSELRLDERDVKR